MNQSVGDEDGEAKSWKILAARVRVWVRAMRFKRKKSAISFMFLKEHLNAGGEQTGRRREKWKAVVVVRTRRGDGLLQADGHRCGGKGSGSRCILEGDPVGFVDVLDKGTHKERGPR